MASTVPSFTPAIARAIAEDHLAALESEFAATRKVVAAVTTPDFRLEPKGRTAFELASHLITSELQFLEEIADMKFTMEKRHKTPANVQELLTLYDRKFPEAIARIRAMKDEQLNTPVDFYGVIKLPDFQYVGITLRHSIHHRGQLAAYLRPMGSKVPSIYGGSADEPWKA
jgi:uncharacterized damage-inducible protein DinB